MVSVFLQPKAYPDISRHHQTSQANSPGVCVKLLEAVATMRLQRNDFHFGAAIHSCERLGAGQIYWGAVLFKPFVSS